MAQQEVGIRLKADTSDAVRSVQEFERTVQGMEGLESKGGGADGFLSRKDVEEFKRLSEEAERIHRSFQEKLDRSARELEQKRTALSSAKESGASTSTTQSLERQVSELEAQQRQHTQAQERVGQQQQRYETSQQTVSDYKTEPAGAGSNIYALGNQSMGAMAGLLGAGLLISQASQGMGLIRSEEEFASTTGQRTPGVDGDFRDFRERAAETGLRDSTAYSATDTLQTMDTYTTLAGTEGLDDSMEAVNQLQVGSRAMGLDADMLAGTTGSLTQMGALDTSTIKAFQEGMVGAIKETGMDGRDAEFTQAVTGLAQQVGRGQRELDNNELTQLLGLQTVLGQTGYEGLKGEQGANVLAGMDAAVKGSDNRLDLMLGWGTEFQGMEGRAELERFKAGGIGDPELMSRLMTNMDRSFGGDKDMMALFMQETMGMTIEQADALLEDQTFNQLKEGGMTEEELKAVTDQGLEEVTKRTDDWADSDAQRRLENEAENEDTKRHIGDIPDRLWQGAQEMWHTLPGELQAGVIGTGALASGPLIGKGMKGLKNLGPKVGEAAKGAKGAGAGGLAKKAGEAAKGAGKGAGRMAKGAGRLMAPVGAGIASYEINKVADEAGDSLADWFMGYDEGDIRRDVVRDESFLGSGLKSREMIENPEEYADEDRYQESKKNVFSRSWDWITGGGDDDEDEAHGGGAVTEPIPKQGEPAIMNGLIDTTDPNNPNVMSKEELTLNNRRTLQDQMEGLLEQEKELIDERKGLLGLGGFGTSAMMGIGEGGGGGGTGGMLGAVMGTLVEELVSGGGADGEGGTSALDGGDLTQQSLKSSATMSAEEIDEWINAKAPQGSIMRGQGAAFAQAAQESGLDARYLVSHAAHETGWGTSSIAKDKGNMYGIGAFDASPYASAYGYSNTQAGIVEGANWIAQNYTNKGQDTLESMRYNDGVHEYATDPEWHTKIANIMKGAGGFGGGAMTEDLYRQAYGGGANTQRIEVVVSGSVENLTAENNDQVAAALQQALLNETQYSLGTGFRQGVGGDR